MVYRFEMAPRPGKRNILQYMVPWLCNVELVDDGPHAHLVHTADDFTEVTPPPPESVNAVLPGKGWGSTEGTRVVLHNLLYITAKVRGCNNQLTRYGKGYSCGLAVERRFCVM